jgi:predicted nucleic acid-binding protein
VTTYGSVLLDTCVIIQLERLDLGEWAECEAVVSAVSVAELAYGLDIDDPVEARARRDRYFATLNNFDVLPFDEDVAAVYGTMAGLVRRAGRNPRPRRLDLQIAATASHNLVPLLTRNPKDFAGLERVVQVVGI